MIFTTTREIAPDVTLSFKWHGGEYIDITAAGMSHPSEVINVWDSYSDRPRIERAQEAFEEKVDDWIAGYAEGRNQGERALLHDVLNNWS
jgi:hypothetical protein